MEIKIEAYSSTMGNIVPENTVAEQVATGFGFTEGPVWCRDHLLFSDIPQNRIVRWQMRGAGPEVVTFRNPSGNSNGLTLDKSGRLIACEHSTRRITRTELDGSISVLAERYKGHRLNSPNDVVARSDGSIYFTDPPYGLQNFDVGKELSFNGVYRIDPDGKLVLLADDFDRPNGLAFSPDENILYINDTSRGHIRAFDVSKDGSLNNGRIFIEMQLTEPGAPDGMKVDQQGNIYCTGPGGFWIINSSGQSLGRIIFPELPANFAWGDMDCKTLYITARTSIYRLRLVVPGIAVY
ncbi:MAG: SMP-30/gluconolactonase/LRE family protein [Dehalococcoidales bacterium]|nr:SMP-30/gluconolactonase/LRE family protein [Dehalococcoidales bacterium]